MNFLVRWIIKLRIKMNEEDYKHHTKMAEFHMKRLKKLRAKLGVEID